MSLRDRLSGKARRRVVVPVAVTDPTGPTAAADEARTAHLLAERSWGKDDERSKAAAVRREEAETAVRECFEQVEFEACPPKDFEAIQARVFPRDRNGDVDNDAVDELLPELAAACAVAEELRDADFWREQLTAGTWSFGEKLSLWGALLRCNSQVPDGRIPFG